MKSVFGILTIAVIVGAVGVIAIPPVSAGNCSPPIDYDENYLLERCEGGSYLIDKETGQKKWVKDQPYG